MFPKKSVDSIDYTNDAAKHLRDEAKYQGFHIGSSHANLLVAAYLGYNDRVALLAPNSSHCTDDQWLHHEKPDVDQIKAAISRMKDGSHLQDRTEFIVNTIRDGLAPPCCETGIKSALNIPVGDVEFGEETDWINPSVLNDHDSRFGHCQLCGNDKVYYLTELDEHDLCREHRGEFDLDPEEQNDLDDYVEYLNKD